MRDTAFLVALTFILIFCGVAFGHDEWGNPNWIANSSATSPVDGSHCCGIADCAVLEKDDVQEAKEGLRVRGTVTYGSAAGAVTQVIDELVPFKEVQVSKDGRYWRCKRPDGSRRCFFGPPGST